MKVSHILTLFHFEFDLLDFADDTTTTTQTVTTGHSRTPSPQKPVSSTYTNSPAPSISTTTSSIRVSSATPPNVQSPVYTFLPYTTSPSSAPTSDSPIDVPGHQLATPPLNMFAPKPFRSTASINLDTPNSNEKVSFSISSL